MQASAFPPAPTAPSTACSAWPEGGPASESTAGNQTTAVTFRVTFLPVGPPSAHRTLPHPAAAPCPPGFSGWRRTGFQSTSSSAFRLLGLRNAEGEKREKLQEPSSTHRHDTFAIFAGFCDAVAQTLHFDFDGFSSSVFVHQGFAVLLL